MDDPPATNSASTPTNPTPLPPYTSTWGIPNLQIADAAPKGYEDRLAPGALFFIPPEEGSGAPGRYIIGPPCFFCRKIRRQWCDRGYPKCGLCVTCGEGDCVAFAEGPMALPKMLGKGSRTGSNRHAMQVDKNDVARSSAKSRRKSVLVAQPPETSLSQPPVSKRPTRGKNAKGKQVVRIPQNSVDDGMDGIEMGPVRKPRGRPKGAKSKGKAPAIEDEWEDIEEEGDEPPLTKPRPRKPRVKKSPETKVPDPETPEVPTFIEIIRAPIGEAPHKQIRHQVKLKERHLGGRRKPRASKGLGLASRVINFKVRSTKRHTLEVRRPVEILVETDDEEMLDWDSVSEASVTNAMQDFEFKDEPPKWKLHSRSWGGKEEKVLPEQGSVELGSDGVEVWGNSVDELLDAVPIFTGFKHGFQLHDLNILEALLLPSSKGLESHWKDGVLSVTFTLQFVLAGGKTIENAPKQVPRSTMPSEIHSILLNYRLGLPFALIIGSKFETPPFPIKFPFAVVGWYHVVQVHEHPHLTYEQKKKDFAQVKWTVCCRKASGSEAPNIPDDLSESEPMDISEDESDAHQPIIQVSPLSQHQPADHTTHPAGPSTTAPSLASASILGIPDERTRKLLKLPDITTLPMVSDDFKRRFYLRALGRKLPKAKRSLILPEDVAFPSFVQALPTVLTQRRAIDTMFKGFVCSKCRKANFRTHWTCFKCDACQDQYPAPQPKWNRKTLMLNDQRYLSENSREDLDFCQGMSYTLDEWDDGVKTCTYVAHDDARIRVATVKTTGTELIKSIEDVISQTGNVSRFARYGTTTAPPTKHFAVLVGEGRFPPLSAIEPISFDEAEALEPNGGVITNISEYMVQCASRTFLSSEPIPWSQQVTLLGSDETATYTESFCSDVNGASGGKLVFSVIGSACELKIHSVTPFSKAKDKPTAGFEVNVHMKHGDFVLVSSPTRIKLSLERKGFGIVSIGRWLP